MLIVKATELTEAGIAAGREHRDAVAAYKRALSGAGALLAAEELRPSSSGVRIAYTRHSGKPEVKAGPFAVDEELIAGYALIEAATEEEAMEWALRMPVPASRGGCVIELRQLVDPPDVIRDPRLRALEADLEDHISLFKKI
jgi:hypothetical protein